MDDHRRAFKILTQSSNYWYDRTKKGALEPREKPKAVQVSQYPTISLFPPIYSYLKQSKSFIQIVLPVLYFFFLLLNRMIIIIANLVLIADYPRLNNPAIMNQERKSLLVLNILTAIHTFLIILIRRKIPAKLTN